MTVSTLTGRDGAPASPWGIHKARLPLGPGTGAKELCQGSRVITGSSPGNLLEAFSLKYKKTLFYTEKMSFSIPTKGHVKPSIVNI